METEKNNTVQQGLNDNPEQVNIEAVKDITELEALKAENERLKMQLKDKQDSYDYASKRWSELLRDVENYKALIRVMMEELKWDDATAIGRVSVAGGMDVFEFIERQH